MLVCSVGAKTMSWYDYFTFEFVKAILLVPNLGLVFGFLSFLRTYLLLA
jgi:hypothetical protein